MKNGYALTLAGATGTPNSTYQIIASPTTPNQTGVRYFCSFADGVLRVSMSVITICDSSITPLP